MTQSLPAPLNLGEHRLLAEASLKVCNKFADRVTDLRDMLSVQTEARERAAVAEELTEALLEMDSQAQRVRTLYIRRIK